MPISFEDITDNDVLTWELQLAKEGTLPPEVQALLLRGMREHLEAAAETDYDRGYDDGYAEGLAHGAERAA